MKTTTFDQLKSMLKSMSLSIFPRLRNMEKNIDEIKSTLPTPEKEIIFTKGEDGNYSCNIPHVELWEMDADAIAKNARIINGEEEYSVRGATKKTETLYGNVIQIYADLNVGKYDLPALYHKTLIITYCTPEILGKASAIYGEKVYSLSDARNDNATPDIPVLDGGGWMNRSIDFMEYDALHGKYTLKTMSETTKGGAMVGKGLKMDGDTLNVDEGVYELINTITISDEEIETVTVTQSADGERFKLAAVMVRVTHPATESSEVGYVQCYMEDPTVSDYGVVAAAYYSAMGGNQGEKISNFIAFPLFGRWFGFSLGSGSDVGTNIGIYNYPVRNGLRDLDKYPYIDRVTVRKTLFFAVGTVIEIWGVRA